MSIKFKKVVLDSPDLDIGEESRGLIDKASGGLICKIVQGSGENAGQYLDIGEESRLLIDKETGGLIVTPVGGTGDQHFLGYFETSDALPETAEAGDYAIVGETDTIWVWDVDNEEWLDTTRKGQVASINNLTGELSIIGSETVAISVQDTDKIKVDTAFGLDTTTLSETSTDKVPSSKVVAEYVATHGAKIDHVVNVRVTPTAAQTATAIPNVEANARARVIVVPSVINVGATYVKQQSTYDNLNPIYPDPTNNTLEFTNMSNVNVFVDNVGDSVDLVIQYYA